MTAFPGAGTALERVGGETRLRAIVEDRRLDRRGYDLATGDSGRHFFLVLVDGDGMILDELRSVEVSRSAAIREDQLRLLEEDRAELLPVLDRLARELLESRTPELEKRALGGDR